MKAETRHQSDILREVQAKGVCTILELARRLQVSDETIRRHVRPLVEQGVVQKVHGGIVMPDRLREAPLERRMDQNRDAKQAIARAAAALVDDGDSLILDTGSTTTFVAQELAHHNRLKVVTNSIEIARTLSRETSNSVYMVGGHLNGSVSATFGPAALDFLAQFHVHHGILSLGGINDRHQLLNFELHEADFSRAVIRQASSIMIVADHTKFSRRALVTVGEVSDIDLFITDKSPPEQFATALADNDVKLVTA